MPLRTTKVKKGVARTGECGYIYIYIDSYNREREVDMMPNKSANHISFFPKKTKNKKQSHLTIYYKEQVRCVPNECAVLSL